MKVLRLIVLAGALVPAAVSLPAGAAPIERVWNDPEGGSFNDAANWTNGVPGNADVALFDYSGREFYTVYFERASIFAGLKVGDEDVAFDLRGYEVRAHGKSLPEGAAFGLAAGHRAAVRIGGGGTLITDGRAVLAGAADSAADVALAGSAARWTAAALTVGKAGTGRLEVSGGAQLSTPGPSNAAVVIGEQPLARGEVVVTGPGSRWEGRGYLSAGGLYYANSGGEGTISVLNGGAMTQSAPLYVGAAPGGTGRLVAAGVNGTSRSTLQAAGLIVGSRGTGTLLVQDGARADLGYTRIGQGYGATGAAVVGGEAGGFKAEMNVSGGLGIGDFAPTGPTYSGVVTVNDGGLVNVVDSISLGRVTTAGPLGTGTLNIRGGQVRAYGLFLSNGGVNLDAGSFAASTQRVGFNNGASATFTQTGGTNSAVRPDGTPTPAMVDVGTPPNSAAPAAGTYNLRGGTLLATVANNARGTFNHIGGTLNGSVTNTGMFNHTGGTLNGSVTNAGTFNHTGGMLNGNATNSGTFNHTGGTLNGNVTNSGTYVVSAPPPGAGPAAADERTITGTFRNDGTFRVTDATVRFNGTFSGNGTFFSEGSRSHFTTYDTRDASSVIIADEDSELVVSREFWTYSRAANLWDTSRSELHFSGDAHGTQPYYLAISGVDRGATYEGYDQNFAWGALHVDAGKALRLVSPGPGRAIYVGDLLLDGGAQQISSITATSDRVNLYYDANRPANAYLGGETWFAPGAWIIPVPEPAAAMLILPAAWMVLARRRGR